MAKKDTENKDRERNLSLAISQINKEYGSGAIMKLGDKPHSDVSVISTGALALDMALGVYGMPRGRIIEIYGPESSGKTSVCLHTIANAQKSGGTCAFIDTEHALDPQYARMIGVNTQDLLVSQPDCGEDALNIAQTLISSNSVDVLVIDSVAALTPRAELDGQIGDSHVGLQARLMSSALRSLAGAINKTRTCLIFTNQLREKIGVMYGNPEVTPGGKALKFYASIRLEIRRAAVIQNPAGEVLGNRVKVKVVKNKIAPPFRKAEFDIMYNEGISRAGSILDVAVELEIISKKGSWFSFEGRQLGQGREQSKDAIKSDEKLETTILDRVKTILKKDGAPEEEEVNIEA
ncbi:recombinase RecA [Lentisphaera profundi]|uniref:Protein RecA n=1 Tax=Lentisphaera profundi TaxID=1658616 RepID=A0ABY7VPR0_9BACT|nr:recombinase RecA [Lentisphaera profundi]WDE96150.1 recombinase RecA [Lentisphaera profundi]